MSSENRFSSFFHSMILLLSLFILLLLLASAGISTSMISGDYHEHTYFLPDSLPINIIFFFAAVILLRIMSPRLNRNPLSHTALSQFKTVLILGIFLFSALWSILTQPVLISDQLHVQECAEQINYKDYSCLMPGGYLERHHQQIGVTVIISFFQLFLGRDNWMAFHLLNAACIALIYLALIETAEQLEMSPRVTLLIPVCGFLFFPLLLYSTFVYGTIPSFLFSLLAANACLKNSKAFSWQNAVKAAVFLGISALIKFNALIYLIALGILSMISFFQSKNWRHLLCILMMALAVYLATALPKLYLERKTGIQISQGIHSSLYLAMGLQDGYSAPGWYNGFINEVYGNGNISAAEQKDIALKNISERLTAFGNDPQDTLRFFIQKITSQWNNPTFESFWINQVRGSNIRPAQWVRRLSRPTGTDLISRYLNLIQFLLLALSVVSVIHMYTAKKEHSLYLLLPFFGGFLFHLLWEGKCQYTLPYFTLLIPLAADGASVLSALSPQKIFENRRTLFISILSLGVFILLSIWLSQSGFITGDQTAYLQYLEEVRMQ